MDEWVVLGGSGSDTDDASNGGSERGFVIVRGRWDGDDRSARLVSPVDNSVVSDAPASPPGLFKVVSYGDAFSALSSGDTGHGDEAEEDDVERSDLDDEDVTLDTIVSAAINNVSGLSTAAVPAVTMVTSPTPNIFDATVSHDEALPELSVGMKENAETEEAASDYGEEEGYSDEPEDSTSESSSVYDDDTESSGESEDEGDHVTSDDKDVEPKASSESCCGECDDIEISDADESDSNDDLKADFLVSNTEHIARDDIEISDADKSDNNDDLFDLKADFLISNTEHIARDSGEEHGHGAESELEVAASNANKEQPECHGRSYDDIDEDSDMEEDKYGYIGIMPSPRRADDGKTWRIVCDDGEAKATIGGNAKERSRESVRSYDDIDTSDEEEGNHDIADDDSDGDLSAATSGVEKVEFVARKYDDIDTSDESDYEEDDDCDSSEMEDDCSDTEESSGDEDDETCSSSGEESSCDDGEEKNKICGSAKERRERERVHSYDDIDTSDESDYEEDEDCDSSDVEDSSGTEESICDEDDKTCSSDGEESNSDEDDDEESDYDEGDDNCDHSSDVEDSSGTEESSSVEDDETCSSSEESLDGARPAAVQSTPGLAGDRLYRR